MPRYVSCSLHYVTYLWRRPSWTSAGWSSLPERRCWDNVRAGTSPCPLPRTPTSQTHRYPTVPWAPNMAAPRVASRTESRCKTPSVNNYLKRLYTRIHNGICNAMKPIFHLAFFKVKLQVSVGFSQMRAFSSNIDP